MFNDFDSWDGLSGLGALFLIGGWGLPVYLAYAFGFQSGIEATTKCADARPQCVVQAKTGWLGVEYKVIASQPASAVIAPSK
ncbi:hypothetical protein [Aquitalea palustris]|uniref:hypothetical protein n=1 Tax=Aquitalea palustris TaxID=2480983 RepID=UPI001CF0B4F9|nr:hypothetical protein [Aquitalea palustris]